MCHSFMSGSQESPPDNVTFWRSLEGSEERSCIYLGKGVLGKGDSRNKDLRQVCARYLRNGKEAGVSGKGRNAGDEVREVTGVEGPTGHWLVVWLRWEATEGISTVI